VALGFLVLSDDRCFTMSSSARWRSSLTIRRRLGNYSCELLVNTLSTSQMVNRTVIQVSIELRRRRIGKSARRRARNPSRPSPFTSTKFGRRLFSVIFRPLAD
jgi:hypothetical protein